LEQFYRVKICAMRELDISADDLTAKLLGLAATEIVCILDSCGVSHLGSHLLIAGIKPVAVREESSDDPNAVLGLLESQLSTKGHASVFTLSYEFGTKLNAAKRSRPTRQSKEPDLFIASFDCLIVHDYDTGRSFVTGNVDRFHLIEETLANAPELSPLAPVKTVRARSNFTRGEYVLAVECIKEKIRSGDTYQTNLTQRIEMTLQPGVKAGHVFASLRKHHPAPFASFLSRKFSSVVSASPERFFKVANGSITASPIKGTRRRGKTPNEDIALREQLLTSEKDRAENTMIVDLTRNDLGRICEFGSVIVERLCELEEHPTLFHLVSTITGKLMAGLPVSEIVRALFPCGSITGAPKLSTMKIIAELEPSPRGLSMGSIGVHIPSGFSGLEPSLEMNVAIRTMVVSGSEAVFNVGGGIVIDSDPESEYDESLLKAQAPLTAAGAELSGN